MTVYHWKNCVSKKPVVNQIRDYYDSVYRCHELALQTLLREPCEAALDIACGHGESTKSLETYACSIVGIDQSEDLIDIAIAQNEHPRTQYYCCDFRDFEVEAGSFDLVSAAWYWNHVHSEDELESAAQKICSLLRPGGCVAFVVPGDAFTSRRIQDIARQDFQWSQAWTHERPESTEGVFAYDETWVRTKIWQPFFLLRKFSRWFDLSTWDVKATLVREGRLPNLCSEPPFEILYGRVR